MSVIGIMELDNGMTALFDAAMVRTRQDHYEIVGTKGSVKATRALEVFQTLIDHNYYGWAMLEGEQDPAVNDPFLLAQSALKYIKSLVK